MDIHSGRMILSLDDKTGGITKIVDGKTGLVHLDAQGDGRDDARLFRVIVPEGLSLTAGYIDSHEIASPKIDRTGKTVSLRWENIRVEDEATGVSIEVVAEVLDNAEEVRFVMKLENHGEKPVLDVMFPFVSGWTGIGGKGKDQMILGAAMKFDPFSLPQNRGTTYGLWHQRVRAQYPRELYAPWIDLSGPGGGISYIAYNTEAKNCYGFMENLAGYQRGPLRLSYGLLFPTVVEPGETWETPPIGISVHGGDWKETADRYRESTKKWFSAPGVKKDLRESIGYQNVFIRNFEGRTVHRLDEISALAKAGKKFGVNHLTVWDRPPYMHEDKSELPKFFNYTTEEKKMLAGSLATAREEGVNVSAINNFLYYRHGIPNIMSTMDYTHEEVLRSYAGTPWTENFGITSHVAGLHLFLKSASYVLSPFSKPLRARILKEVHEYRELGFASLFWDQPYITFPDYGHRSSGDRPEDTQGAVLSLIKEARAILEQKNPKSCILGIYCDVFGSQYIDMWMLLSQDVEQYARTAYAIPQTMLSWVVDGDPAQASRAFAVGAYLALCTHGMEGTLADEPEFGRHVAKLAALREKCAARTVHARFNYTRGLKIDGNDHMVAYGYDGANGPAVIMAAPEAKGRIAVTVDRQMFSNPGTGNNGMVHRLDGSSQPHSGDSCSLELLENEVVVWEL